MSASVVDGASSAGPIKTINTYCRICEPQCGITASVRDGKIIKVESNRHHVHSQGHFCIKAPAAAGVVYDEDRVLYPLKRTGAPGEFTRISWDEALSEIAEGLSTIRLSHGKNALATFVGNPMAYNLKGRMTCFAFAEAWRFAGNMASIARMRLPG